MDWNKAKNYTIVLLLILNGVLLGFNIINAFGRRLSNAEVENIITVLENNNISMEAEIPTDAKNLSQLSLEAANYSLFDLVNIFFETDESIKRTEEFNATIFKAGNRELRVEGDVVSYTDGNLSVSNIEGAREAAEKYMEKILELFPDFSYEYSMEKDGEYKLKYGMYYKGNNCFNNVCKFNFDKSGMTLTLRYLSPRGFFGTKSEVYSADVILLAFMNGIRELYPDESLTVIRLELGYLSRYENDGEASEAIPYYRIIVAEKSETYYINGYTAAFMAV